MTTGNHLTIRDYFDQLKIYKTVKRYSVPSDRSNSAEDRTFNQILSASRKKRFKTRGLKVADYLANPVQAAFRSKINPKPEPIAEKTNSQTDGPASAESQSPERPTAQAAGQEKADRRKPLPSVLALPEQPSDSSPRQRIEKSIHTAARKYDLPPNVIKGVIKAESNFQITAVSHAGARGLMQLMPETARELGVDDPFDIEQNIDGGARYLRQMLDKFGGDLKTALAAYNAGPGAVEKYGGNVPPYPETKQYVRRVLRFSRQTA